MKFLGLPPLSDFFDGSEGSFARKQTIKWTTQMMTVDEQTKLINAKLIEQKEQHEKQVNNKPQALCLVGLCFSPSPRLIGHSLRSKWISSHRRRIGQNADFRLVVGSHRSNVVVEFPLCFRWWTLLIFLV